MAEEFKYSYEDMITLSNEIINFSSTFQNQILDLRDNARNINRNYQSEASTEITNAIDTVAQDAGQFEKAIREFARAIAEDIAPNYRNIESAAAASATDMYKQEG